MTLCTANSSSLSSDFRLFSSERWLCSGQAPVFLAVVQNMAFELTWCTLLVFHLSGITILRWLLPSIETHLFPIFGINCLWQEGYSNMSSSVMTGSRSELPINFNFPFILPPETYRKTVFYSLLYVLLFFFLIHPPFPTPAKIFGLQSLNKYQKLQVFPYT